MFITFTNRTHYQMQNTAGARMYEPRQVVEVTDADGNNLKAMDLARESTRPEVAELKAAEKSGQEYIAPDPNPPKQSKPQPSL